MLKLKKSRNSLGAAIAEFGPALFIFFLFVLFPLVNLIAMGTGAATVYLISKQCASKAASSTTFAQALGASQSAAHDLITGGFGKFANLNPIGGYNGSGVDLYITETNIASNVSTRNGPNTPNVTNPVDTTQYLYSYDAVVTCDVGPLMNLNGVPFIGSIPGLGTPARLTYTASENVEHAEDLTVGVGGPPPGGGILPPLPPPGGSPGGGGASSPPIGTGPGTSGPGGIISNPPGGVGPGNGGGSGPPGGGGGVIPPNGGPGQNGNNGPTF